MTKQKHKLEKPEKIASTSEPGLDPSPSEKPEEIQKDEETAPLPESSEDTQKLPEEGENEERKEETQPKEKTQGETIEEGAMKKDDEKEAKKVELSEPNLEEKESKEETRSKEESGSEPSLEKVEEKEKGKKRNKDVSGSEAALEETKLEEPGILDRVQKKKKVKGKKGKKGVEGSEASLGKAKKGKGKEMKKVASKGKASEAEESIGDVPKKETAPSAVSIEESPEEKVESAVKVKKEKKKDRETKEKETRPSIESGGEETKKKKKRKKGEKGVTISEVHLVLEEDEPKRKKRKEKKMKKARSATDKSVEVPRKKQGMKKIKKSRLDKVKKVLSYSEPSLQEITESKTKVKRGTSTSKSDLKKGKKSQPSLQQLLSRLSMHTMEMEELRSKSKLSLGRSSSEWTLGSSPGSEESFEEIPKEPTKSSLVVPKRKDKKGKKGKKEKKLKEKEETTTEPTEEEGEPKKEKKKKGKKKRLVEGEEPVPEIEPQDDVLAEIARMKYLAELEASGETDEEATTVTSKPKKKKKAKKGPKKKLSKKEKARLAAEQAEKAKINAEEEAAKAAELERIRLEEERKAAIEKERREVFEQQIRMEQLETVMEQLNELVSYNKALREGAKAEAEWEFYVNCGRLPNPGKCDQMNTFLHLWENMIEETSMEEAAKRTVDVLELLNELDDLIDTTEEQKSDVIDNWKWVRLLFRRQQAKSLDVATYRLLRNIEKNLNRIDIPTADYKYQDDNIALCLWLRIQLPTPLPNPRRPPKPRIEVNFPQMKLEVQFPQSLDGDKVAVRALYVKYDHLSDLCLTYDKPPIPEQYDTDLYQAMKMEWREKLIYKYKNRVRKQIIKEEVNPENPENPENPPEEEIGPDEDVPVVPYRKLEPTASEHVISEEDTIYSTIRSELIKIVADDVINLRKNAIIGGVYSLNLVHQPPQPQDFVTLEMNLTPLYLPKQLELVDLCLEYNPPPPPEPGVRRPPEEIEEEMKKQEEELERLIFVTLTWPDHVIFLELPMVCYWDDDRRVWTKNEVHDLKHNEEKGQLSFRTLKCGTFALAVYRYANLPYQAWEMRPEINGSISLQITAAILMVEFNVKDGLIALSQLQNSPNNALQDIVGNYFPLPKLIRMLQNAGVDVFPAFDAFCYIENTCEKHWPMEKQLYFNMAQLGICFNFAWSRWNMAAGRRSVILQMREYNLERTKQKNHLMMHMTPLSALYVDCTEVSQTFNPEGIENSKFYPDLYHLMKGTSSMALKNKIAKASKELVFALYELLIVTRVVSFS